MGVLDSRQAGAIENILLASNSRGDVLSYEDACKRRDDAIRKSHQLI